MNHWDIRYIELANHISSWSKDPSTKCGAVIVRPDKTIAGVGYNGFPRYMGDYSSRYINREDKYSRVVHCEMNAILNCRDQSLVNYKLYLWPFLSCDRCAVHVINSGISEVYYPESGRDRWREYHDLSVEYFSECGVSVRYVPGT